MKRLVFAILVVLSLAVAANAQTFRGSINGTVVDPSGAAVHHSGSLRGGADPRYEHRDTEYDDRVRCRRGYSPERPGLYAIDRRSSWIRRLCRWRLRLDERYSSKPD